MQYLAVCVICILFVLAKPDNITVEEYLHLLNTKQSSWRAGSYTKATTLNKSTTRSLAQVVFYGDRKVKKKSCDLEGVVIPETFDARTHWPACSDIIGKIRSQGRCHSCWAFSAAEVMSDRLCIHTNGEDKFIFSPQDLISCCEDCDVGCLFGYPSKAWKYYVTHGVVSGGDFASFEGCKPYDDFAYFDKSKSTCNSSCDNPLYYTPYIEDKKFGSEYYMVNKTPECIQAEIMENGPVQALMGLYEDFYFYKDGVYSYTLGAKVGTHAVRILGWGVERGIPYWLVANSWNSRWGDLNGFFKIRRGNDERGIEQHVIAGKPLITTSHKTAGKPLITTSHKTEQTTATTTVATGGSDNHGVIIFVVFGVPVLLGVAVLVALRYKEPLKDSVGKYLRFR